jgi:hypothetical protein
MGDSGNLIAPGSITWEVNRTAYHAIKNYLATIWYQPNFYELVEVGQQALEAAYGRRWLPEAVTMVVRQAILSHHRDELRDAVRRLVEIGTPNPKILRQRRIWENEILARYQTI